MLTVGREGMDGCDWLSPPPICFAGDFTRMFILSARLALCISSLPWRSEIFVYPGRSVWVNVLSYIIDVNTRLDILWPVDQELLQMPYGWRGEV